ncbi:MAG: hypothetical protein II921_03250 [Treponema sp.]|nr:hypothetical protein [Treponema sp.]
MRSISILSLAFLLFSQLPLFSADYRPSESIYRLPEDLQLVAARSKKSKKIEEQPVLTPAPLPTVQAAVPEKQKKNGFIIAGTKDGLIKIFSDKVNQVLWNEGSVSKIIKADDGNGNPKWYFLTSKGILTSTDLSTFEYANNGLPFLTIKLYDGKDITFQKQAAQLKDLEIHPQNPNILVTATKDAVYITKDGGANWTSIGSTSASTSGIKAVAVCNINSTAGKPAVLNVDGSITPEVPPASDLVVFMAHSIFGFSYKKVDAAKPAWNDCNGGFENMKTQTYPDEIADIRPVVFKNSNGFLTTEVFVSQSFMPRIYRFDWGSKRGQVLYVGEEPADTIDGLFWYNGKLLFSRPGAVNAFNPVSKELDSLPSEYGEWGRVFNTIEKTNILNSVWIPQDAAEDSGENLATNDGFCLSELWLLYPDDCNNKYADKALGHKSVYVQAHKLMTAKGINEYKKIIKDNKLDSMVIDMKDDYGGIRFEPNDPLIKQKGYVSRYKIDIDTFVPEMKKEGIYLIARIVTFKDKNLAQYDKQQYAVWDKTTNRPWKGIQGYESIKDENGTVTGSKTLYYDEDWVDPYSPEVWEYFVHIAQELVERGFDEIQFDYIRFPTDGKNMGNATFRWKSPGMDKESALLSFLSYARKNIDAPIGIDIYGANGWYRSGTRTGQDVEQLAEYVDIICPMFYPSHFEQSFLNYAPYTERPYRVYYYGTYRNTVIGRNRLIIRPWVQAFYLNVSYDRNYYGDGKNYVSQQIYGVRDSVNRGYMYWNGLCNYPAISPDVGDQKYNGPSYEADDKYRKPALSGGKREEAGVSDSEKEEIKMQNQEGISLWDSVREHETRHESYSITSAIEKLM